ncbi:NeuD/PglB/VioB family sugar acetyltransferase [bacterium]|nr:NeuD/PglB/VioB family sugar acetyltransferase [bacterium]
MTERLAIVGAGGFGRETYDQVLSSDPFSERWSLSGFIDPMADEELLLSMGSRWLGSDSDFLDASSADAVLIAVGDPQLRYRIASLYRAAGVSIADFIHPSVECGSLTFWGEGCIISSGVMLMNNSILGNFVNLDRRSMIGHDSRIGDFATLHPAAVISGNVTVGAYARMGTCSCVLPSISIGSSVVVAAGAVVTSSVAEGVTVAGVPAKLLAQD